MNASLRTHSFIITTAVTFCVLFATGQVASAQTCMQNKVNFGLNCTANDVRVAKFNVIAGPSECTVGEPINVTLQAEEVATASERYDVGLFVALDGGNALTGSCHQDYLPPPLSTTPTAVQPRTAPFFNAEAAGDTCGDLEQGIHTLRDLVPLTIECQDSNHDGIADVGTCTSWDNQKSRGTQNSPHCTSIAQTLPGPPAKCNCEPVQVGNIHVKGKIVVDKVTNPSGDPTSFHFQLGGGPGGVSDSCNLTDASTPFEFLNLTPGATPYVLNECSTGEGSSCPGVPPGWALDHVTCSSDQNHTQTPGNIVLHNGETVTCTFYDNLVDLCVKNNRTCPA